LNEPIPTAAAASRPEVDTNVEHITGILKFWVNAMGHLHIIAGCMTEQDVECSEHLTDIQCNDTPNGDGFNLSFHFWPNEYFSNTVLTKRCLIPNFLLEEEPVMEIRAKGRVRVKVWCVHNEIVIYDQR
jgi:hypothetical protein